MVNHRTDTKLILWIVFLLICPVSIYVLGGLYQKPPPLIGNLGYEPPWTVCALRALFFCQFVISLGAAVAALVNLHHWAERVLAWSGVLVLLGITAVCYLFADIAISGFYL